MRTAKWLALTALAVSGCATTANRGTAMPDDPILTEAMGLIEAGRLADAERILRDRCDNPGEAAARRRDDQIEIIRRIRLDFPLDAEQMLSKLRTAIPDATADDVRRWRDEGVLQHRVLDGQVRFFNTEPSNLFKFSQDARARWHRTPQGAARAAAREKADREQVRHLTEIVHAAEATGAVELAPVRHRVTCTIHVQPKPGRVRNGSLTRIWMVYPQEYRQQKDVRLVRSTPAVTTIAPNWDQAPRGQRQRSLYFEQRITDPAAPIRAEAVFEWTVAAYCPRLDPARVLPYDTNSPLYREFTAERPPHIVFPPEMRAVAERETAGIANPLERARRLWLWVCRNMRYAYEVEYSTIPSLSLKALRTRRGDCGVQAMLFITLCRAAGIPARWQSGWETKPTGYTMHDWAEFYVEPWGWLPADPSYGLQDSDDPRVHEFYFGHLDPYRCIVNLDYCCPLIPPKESFRSEPVDFQRGEVEIDGQNVYYDEWSCTFRVEWLDGVPAQRP